MKEYERRSKGPSKQVCKYSSTDVVGEGFGKYKVGMTVELYTYVQIKYDQSFTSSDYYDAQTEQGEKKGTLIKIVRRINGGYYDYWYKVRLADGKEVWRSPGRLT